ncbi:MAG: ABC transporter permease [Verrucomicrobia bacterium]|nr:ABC transporter permease [Verrucomicrobiota bacterium]
MGAVAATLRLVGNAILLAGTKSDGRRPSHPFKSMLEGVRKVVNLDTVLDSPLPRSYTKFVGRWLLHLVETVRQVGAFALISLGVMVTRWNRAKTVIHPLIANQIAWSGIGQLPIVTFLACALGFAVIGQTVALLSRVGAQDLIGTVMVTVVVRELGPVITAGVVLLRVGTATVIELGTARASGEVEALEALGIDPVHYLVVPRMIGMATAVVCLSAYLIVGTLFSGYMFAFLQDVPLVPGEYFKQVVLALRWEDFVLLTLKGVMFGLIIATVTCFHGLARPIQLTEVSVVATRALLTSLILCVLVDAAFLLVYLLM